MNLDQRYVIPEESMSRRVGAETVILHLSSGTYFGLDAVGTRAWTLLSEGKSLGEACTQMLEEFDVSRTTLETDICRLAEELTQKNLIRLA